MIDEKHLNRIIQGDCLELFKNIPDNSVDMTFADPPFNLHKKYTSYKDNLEFQEYLDWCEKWIAEMVRVTKPTGSIFLHNIPKWLTFYATYLNNLPISSIGFRGMLPQHQWESRCNQHITEFCFIQKKRKGQKFTNYATHISAIGNKDICGKITAERKTDYTRLVHWFLMSGQIYTGLNTTPNETRILVSYRCIY